MRRVGVVTVGRSDYGIYRPILRELVRRDDVEPLLFVGGAHLVERFGSTFHEIEQDGFPIAERIPFLGDGDTDLDVAEAIGRGVAGFAAAFVRHRPEIVLVLGDRSEMLAAGVAALPLRLPLAHLHGGELTEGAIDDASRHALTKLSHLHFTATEEFARRVEQLGEEPWRVRVTGAPALDTFLSVPALTDEELAARGVGLRGPTLLVTYHPVTLAREEAAGELEAVLAAVDASGLDAVLTYPNSDAGHGAIVAALERLAAGDERFTLVRNLGADAYATLLRRAVAMVGNSSSGIIEAASFALPVVNVGPRQRGRPHGPNVVDVPGDAGEITAAIGRVVTPAVRASLEGLPNPYGDGTAAGRIAERVATVPLDERLLVKRFHVVP